MKTYARPYDWNVICQICREKIKASQSVRRWDGLIVGAKHPGCFEYRSPLDMPAPPLRDQRPLPYTSPRTSDASVANGVTSTISVGVSPFTYIVGSYPEKINFTGSITTMTVNGQIIPPPISSGDNVSSVQYGPGTKLVITYAGVLTMTTLVITGYNGTL